MPHSRTMVRRRCANLLSLSLLSITYGSVGAASLGASEPMTMSIPVSDSIGVDDEAWLGSS